ncbi:MAG: type 11 methyltransferase [Verrucomicrobiales bacterium]|nr:type 11 methyltransferase [Verrucomicrobiales bacterium]
MKTKLLEVLRCPRCSETMKTISREESGGEIRTGTVVCNGPSQHTFDIVDGIVRMATGFDHDAVKRELEYENTTYTGSDRLRDPKLIGNFPETLAELWPHTCNFGPDFKVLIDHLKLKAGDWVLDVGTGPCWSSRMLAQTGANVIALDVNEADFYGLKTSDILFEMHNVYFERILESMTNLPFKDDSLDYITFNASFHHTPDMEQTLTQCYRVLKPGGMIAMVNEEFASLRQKVFVAESATDTGSHHTIPYAEFEKSVENHGYQISYFVAAHVQEKLAAKLGKGMSSLIVNTMEKFPITLKQLNSALILLQKPVYANKTKKQNECVSA